MKNKKRKKRPCIMVNVTEEFLFDIKKRALFRGQTMASWVRMAIGERIKIEDQYQ
jgi:hypothetical protein